MTHRDPVTLLADLGVALDTEWLEIALTHRSYAYENGGLPHNERLEFLGDSVLGLVVTDTLFSEHPERSEGDLARMRAVVVNATALASVSRSVDLGAYLRLGRGEEQTGGREKSSILADTMESIIGAVYVNLGLATATELVHRFFDPLIARAATLTAGLDWKTSLQEISASRGLGVPEYLLTETGPDHAKEFTAHVRVGEQIYGEGFGRSKKEAEQQVAEAAYTAISEA